MTQQATWLKCGHIFSRGTFWGPSNKPKTLPSSWDAQAAQTEKRGRDIVSALKNWFRRNKTTVTGRRQKWGTNIRSVLKIWPLFTFRCNTRLAWNEWSYEFQDEHPWKMTICSPCFYGPPRQWIIMKRVSNLKGKSTKKHYDETRWRSERPSVPKISLEKRSWRRGNCDYRWAVVSLRHSAIIQIPTKRRNDEDLSSVIPIKRRYDEDLSSAKFFDEPVIRTELPLAVAANFSDMETDHRDEGRCILSIGRTGPNNDFGLTRTSMCFIK